MKSWIEFGKRSPTMNPKRHGGDDHLQYDNNPVAMEIPNGTVHTVKEPQPGGGVVHRCWVLMNRTTWLCTILLLLLCSN